MSKIGLFFGSDTGNTESMAEQIRDLLGGEDVVDLKDISVDEIEEMHDYEKIIIGVPTWYEGDLQSAWMNVYEEMDKLDLNGKTIAFFGCGDQEGYTDNFLDAMGTLHEKVTSLGAKTIGKWSTEGYEFEASKAVIEEGFFVGVGFDFENQMELNDERCEGWVNQIKGEFEL